MVTICCNRPMNDIVSIRRNNLARLVRKHSLSLVAHVTGKPARQLSDMIAGRKSFGEKVARDIEEGWKKWDPRLPDGWLSVPSTDDDKEETPVHKSNVVQMKRTPEEILIPHFDAGGAMGHGLELRDQPGIIQSWRVNPEWLERNVRAHSSAKNLCIVTGFGDSMQPLFNPGDPLLVDIGVKSVEFDSIYFFRIGNDGYVKRLQRIPTERGLVIRARSENREAYDPFDITESMDFEVLGRVLKVWRSHDL